MYPNGTGALHTRNLFFLYYSLFSLPDRSPAITTSILIVFSFIIALAFVPPSTPPCIFAHLTQSKPREKE